MRDDPETRLLLVAHGLRLIGYDEDAGAIEDATGQLQDRINMLEEAARHLWLVMDYNEEKDFTAAFPDLDRELMLEHYPGP